MGIYIKGKPREGTYRLTYKETSDKGIVAVLERDGIAFIGQIIKTPHGRLIDADKAEEEEWKYCSDDLPSVSIYPTVIEAEGIDDAYAIIEAKEGRR